MMAIISNFFPLAVLQKHCLKSCFLNHRFFLKLQLIDHKLLTRYCPLMMYLIEGTIQDVR